MTLEVLVIGLVRILGSLPVLRWALVGGVLAILVDLSDLFLMNLLDLGGFPDYQAKDKWLDQVYLALFLLVALRWRGPARTIAVVLYAYRLLGFVLFEVAGERWVLFLFPNVFEFWFLYVAFRLWRHRRRTSEPISTDRIPALTVRRPLVLALLVLTAAKLAHEYVIHVARALDSFTAIEAVEAIWNALPF